MECRAGVSFWYQAVVVAVAAIEVCGSSVLHNKSGLGARLRAGWLALVVCWLLPLQINQVAINTAVHSDVVTTITTGQ